MITPEQAVRTPPHPHQDQLNDGLFHMKLGRLIGWLYALDHLKYLERDEVLSLEEQIVLDQTGSDRTYRPLSEHCRAAGITRVPKKSPLDYFSLDYKLPKERRELEERLDPNTSKIALEPLGRKFTLAVEVLSGGSPLLLDLYRLESFGEVHRRHRLLSEQEDPESKKIHWEKYTQTNFGSNHAWGLGLLWDNRLVAHLKKGDLVVLGKYQADTQLIAGSAWSEDKKNKRFGFF